MRPKKSLGQNFLRDPKILQKIADAAQISKEDLVVEIGPGEGGLTECILKLADKVIAIEKDEQLVEFLNQKFQNQVESGELQIVSADVLGFDIEKNLETNYKLVGNIPYYITGSIFKKFLSAQNKPKSLTFIVQKEVAERIIAEDKKESVLSISVKAYGAPVYGGTIKAGSFYPAPKVDSAIISIRDVNTGYFDKYSVSEDAFFEILKQGFAHKRKYLTSNLKEIFDAEKIKTAFQSANLDEKIRSEDLQVEDWFKLARSLV